ncbi:MAG: ATP-binding protein [Vicinamibacteria bacterium]|nr:ATP-binding protein [Vicinamibacteria bacterium]
MIQASAHSSAAAIGASSKYIINVWDTENGLPSSSVTSIAQTPEGYLWIGTNNGLVRFDGMRFVTFDPFNTPALGHARAENLYIDAQGTLWINTFDGSLTTWRQGVFAREWAGVSGVDFGAWLVSSRHDRIVFLLETGDLIRRHVRTGAGGDWQVLRPPGDRLSPVYCEDSARALWIRSANDNLWRLTGDEFESVPWTNGLKGAQLNYLTTDREGRVWIATDRELAVWGQGRFQTMTPTKGEPTLNVAYLLFTRNGGYWAIADAQAREGRERRWIRKLDDVRDLTGSYRLAINAHEDGRGGVWFAHYGKGLVHVTPNGDVRRISVADGLPGERVRCWFEDREGNVWVGVDRGGLARLREKRFLVLSESQGLSAKAAVSICEDRQDSIWIGTLGGGLVRWRDGVLKSFALPSVTSGRFIFSVYPDRRDRIWMSADREDLFVLDRGRIRPAPWNVHGIKAILVDRQDRIWFGTKSALSCWMQDRLKEFDRSDGFRPSDVRALAEDDRGDVWIGSGDGGVYRFQEGKLAEFRATDAGASQAVWSLLADDDGTIWAGTFRGGLMRLKDGRFTRFTTKDGLLSDVICQILDDDQGNLWLGSHEGILRIAKADLHAFARGGIRSIPCIGYGRSDGLPTLECAGSYQPSCWRGRDGRLWFATTKGVVSIQPRGLTESRLIPPVVIEELLADGESRDVSLGAGRSGSCIIPAGTQRVAIRFTSLSLTVPEKARFRFKLEGLEKDWVDAGAGRWAEYSYLRPGNYRFRVVARGADGAWSEEGARLALRVLPRFWQHWWFRGLICFVALSVFAGTVRFVATRRLRRELDRIERQRAIERDRARIAKDIHDDLGAGLTQITLLSELARSEPPHEADACLGQISDTARDLTRAMDEIVWAVNPQKDTLDSLMSYVVRLAQEHLTVAGIQCRLDVPARLPSLPLVSEARYNLFLAVKEALHNVIKHARASEVWLRLLMEPGSFTLVIEDDGQGFSETSVIADVETNSRLSSGQGLGNIRKRLSAIGGRCMVHSAPGKGTRVELSVVLP